MESCSLSSALAVMAIRKPLNLPHLQTEAIKSGFASALTGSAFPCGCIPLGAEPPRTAWPSLSPLRGNRRDDAKSRPHPSLEVGLFLDPFQIFTFKLMRAFVVRLVTTVHPSAMLISPTTSQNISQIWLQIPRAVLPRATEDHTFQIDMLSQCATLCAAQG